MKFTKMHGCGNDYIYINGFIESCDDWGALSEKLSDRHFSVGSDGVIVILPSDVADFRMRMFNADAKCAATARGAWQNTASTRV